MGKRVFVVEGFLLLYLHKNITQDYKISYSPCLVEDKGERNFCEFLVHGFVFEKRVACKVQIDPIYALKEQCMGKTCYS